MASMDDAESPRRRRFLKWMSRGFLSLWGVASIWGVGAFIKPPRLRGGLADRVLEVGPVDSIPVGQAKLVRHGSQPIIVVRAGEDSYVGLAGICTHLHCVLNWSSEEGQVLCPCHDGAFDLNGNVVQGPPPRPLERFRVETQFGKVYLHL